MDLYFPFRYLIVFFYILSYNTGTSSFSIKFVLGFRFGISLFTYLKCGFNS